MSSGRIAGFARIVVLACVGFALAEGAAAQEPFNVRLVGRFSHGPYMAFHVAGHYVYAGGGQIYHSYRCGWLDVVDVSDPTSPVLVGYISLPDVVERIRVKDGLAYIAADFRGLLIVDVTNPTSPTLRGSYDTPNYAMGLSVSGGLAFIADEYSLQIIDVTNPSSPTLRGWCATPNFAYDVCVSGGMAYIANGDAGLRIVDVTNPSSPVLRSSWGSGIQNVFASNGVAYVTTTFGTFACVDVTSPTAPRLLGSYATVGGGGPLYVSGRYAYASLGDGLRIFDISDPSSPVLCGYYYHVGGDLSVRASLVYLRNPVDFGGLILQFTGGPAQAAPQWNFYR